ncbi:MAG TPA: HAMP domain-containing sensor histidine kinase [Thermoanaerobaculia bacterium]|nr:HAMP domain-containing sensor histidine kinase [Thermoanaerobaculia bacterium]
MNEITSDVTERRSTARTLTERILISAPTGSDAAVMAEVLGSRGFQVVVITDLDSLVAEWGAGAGMVLMASEALNDTDCCVSLRGLFDAQEAWSEIPVVILGSGGEEEAPHLMELLGDRVQILILDRPLGIAAFVSAIEAALRSRLRQYQVKRLLDELAQSAVKLREAHEKANRNKDEFIATLAHELRSPMTAIRGWVEMLKVGGLDPAGTADALSMIESSAKVQAHIIEDLMDVSRILAGKVMIEPASIDLAPAVRTVVATFRPTADIEGIQLAAEIPADPVVVFGDEVRLQQVCWNLLSNAIKFTPRGGTVRLSLIREKASAVIRVQDNGRGISPQLLPRVFERYLQEEGLEKKAHRGLGLGLAIVKHLVEGHGGSITALSEGPGKGAEFVVSLPLRDAPVSRA